MGDRPKSIEERQEEAGEIITEFWRKGLLEATSQVGDQMAATGMFMVALEALRAGMGNDAVAGLLEALAPGIRSGEDVSVTIDGHGTEH